MTFKTESIAQHNASFESGLTSVENGGYRGRSRCDITVARRDRIEVVSLSDQTALSVVVERYLENTTLKKLEQFSGSI